LDLFPLPWRHPNMLPKKAALNNWRIEFIYTPAFYFHSP